MRRIKLIITALFLISPFAANADVIEITGAGANDGTWDITSVTGTFAGLSSTLMDQVWWQNSSLAELFAGTLGDANGLPNVGFGPFFAIAICNTGFGSCGQTPQNYLFHTYRNGSVLFFQDDPNITRTFATATRVPEPGTLALLGIGLFGMGLAKRRKKV